MTVAELIALFRSDVRDELVPQLWSDADIVRYINSALNELARRADYFYDSSSFAGLQFVADDPKIPTESIPSGQSVIPKTPDLNPIIRITRAKVQGQSVPLHVLTIDQVEQGGPLVDDYGINNLSGWETSTGTPRVLVTDYYDDGYRLAPIPNVDGLLDLWVYRFPRFQVTKGDDQQWKALCTKDLVGLAGLKLPEHEIVLLDWMKREGYLKNDGDAYNEELSIKHERRFIQSAMEIKRELRSFKKPAGGVRYGGIM